MQQRARSSVQQLCGALVLLMAAGCGGGGSDAPHSEQPQSAAAPAADVVLSDSSALASLTASDAWKLEKNGSLTGNTVTWNITATKTATTSGHLLLQGQMTVTNTGNGPATIGNVVVNLQKRVGNKWVTASTNVANATQGDAATSANIHKAASSENQTVWSENTASGSLNFMDATNNTVFSLVPQVMIGAGQTRALLFSASFNNNDGALQLTPGTAIRAEVIVTFGNATANGNSTANLDINGNGGVDADEKRVRSVPSRLGVTVPAAVNGNAAVALTDTLEDITSTGDVTFSNVQFNLGATTGTVSASVAGGTNGGSITNCAHLTSADQTVTSGGFTFPIVDGVDLQACSTVAVGGTPPTCTPGAPGCGWKTGEMLTAIQAAWGDRTTAAGAILDSTFDARYPSALVVGGTLTITFSDSAGVFGYLPATGPAGSLTNSVVDPLSTSSGDLGGEVTALRLNTDYSSTFSNAVPLASLRICNFAALPSINGQTVAQFLATANHILGGGTATMSATAAASVSRQINAAFAGGTPSTFAQANLVAAPSCGWKASEMLTFTQTR
jgi:hypothetical protein